MCGIFVCIGNVPEKTIREYDEAIRRRGPDYQNVVSIDVMAGDNVLRLRLSSSVLSLRGEGICKQPVVDNNGCALLFNGEIYQGLEISADQSDTEALSIALGKAGTPEEILAVLSKLRGPYALAYYAQSSKSLWFARDVFGKRSLLYHDSSDGAFALCSTNIQNIESRLRFDDVPTSGVYCLDLNKLSSRSKRLQLYKRESPWCRRGLVPDPAQSSFQEHVKKTFYDLLHKSIMNRLCAINEHKYKTSTVSKIAILFSGGLDSTVLAAMCDDILPKEESIDLVNIAFGPSCQDVQDDDSVFETVHDRIAGLSSYNDLKTRSDRRWNFIKMNVSAKSYKKQEEHIISLMYPRETVTDLGIAASFWFGSQARGILESTGEYHESTAKVVLLGSGSDELLGGYFRYREKYRQGGLISIEAEMKMDLELLIEHNLGRDDRCLSDNGKEARLPFLDEELAGYLLSVPAELKFDMELGPGTGDKILLREVARDLGLVYCCSLPKKAIQFGSKASKLCRKRKNSTKDKDFPDQSLNSHTEHHSC